MSQKWFPGSIPFGTSTFVIRSPVSTCPSHEDWEQAHVQRFGSLPQLVLDLSELDLAEVGGPNSKKAGKTASNAKR